MDGTREMGFNLVTKRHLLILLRSWSTCDLLGTIHVDSCRRSLLWDMRKRKSLIKTYKVDPNGDMGVDGG